ncbi:hypothetical protein TNCV_3506331 [Trichonephila clavipes]|uniref:Uncharacterized protein n=1 Tax=Trichonephila clavipes TaxID=2585209 RepID=A0A8X6VCD9_TRICX|nr:hypothetical protein TNCV_3506331 [Trichonephila clavipes]
MRPSRKIRLSTPGLEHRTPERKALFRCPMPLNTLRVHMEYVLVKSVGPKVAWAVAAETMSAGLWRIFSSPPVHARIVEVESIYRRHLSCRGPTFFPSPREGYADNIFGHR